MIRRFILILGIIASTHANAGCAKWEYAKLKDADKSELTNLYCASVSQAIMAHVSAKNRKAIGQDFASADKLQEQQICMEQIEEAEAMLKKKFKSKPKASCASRYKAEVLDDMQE